MVNEDNETVDFVHKDERIASELYRGIGVNA
jgi:hypothetical protein